MSEVEIHQAYVGTGSVYQPRRACKSNYHSERHDGVPMLIVRSNNDYGGRYLP